MITKKLSFTFETVKEKKGHVQMTINVDWALRNIKMAVCSKNLSDKEKMDLLDEYAKYWIMKKAKLVEYPVRVK